MSVILSYILKFTIICYSCTPSFSYFLNLRCKLFATFIRKLFPGGNLFAVISAMWIPFGWDQDFLSECNQWYSQYITFQSSLKDKKAANLFFRERLSDGKLAHSIALQQYYACDRSNKVSTNDVNVKLFLGRVFLSINGVIRPL